MRHYIIIKFKDKVNAREHLESIKSIFDKALSIDGVENIEIYASNSDETNRADLMIKMTLSHIALMDFEESDIHKQWKDEYRNLIDYKTIFDCE